MVASFLMRMFFFTLKNDDSQKLQLYLVGMCQFCWETLLGKGFSGPGRKFGSKMSGTLTEPVMSWYSIHQ